MKTIEELLEGPKREKREEAPVCGCGVTVPDHSGWINNQRMCTPCFDAWLAKAYPKARTV